MHKLQCTIPDAHPLPDEQDQHLRINREDELNRQVKKLDVPQELLALVSYLHQQEERIQEHIRRLQPGG